MANQDSDKTLLSNSVEIEAEETLGPEKKVTQQTEVTDSTDEKTIAVEETVVSSPKIQQDKETIANELDNTLEVSQSEPGDDVTLDSIDTREDKADATLDFSSRDRESFEVVEPKSRKRKKRKSFVGKTIGNYEVLAELGRGGMGVVYKARDLKLNRVVALKMILAGSHASEDVISRFINEARAVALLQHPNIVQVFDIAHEDELPYFSLEFVEGNSLDDMYKDEPASPQRAAEIVIALAEAMQYAHDQGVIHRDLKPANVLMAEDGTSKITDFGLAKQVEEDTGQTRTGTILGTPGYMSPEQASGMAKQLQPSSDQYSLGAILYRLLGGRAPFVSSRAMDTIMQVIKCDPVPLQQLSPEVPADLETICLKTLSKDPRNRYENCQALADDLHRFLNHEPIVARPINSVEKLARWCKRNPKIASLVATTFFLLVAIAGLMTWSSFAIATERDKAQTAEKEAKDTLVIAIENKEKADANAILAQENELKAKENEAKAKENEKIAKDQAVNIVKTMQKVLTEIDAPLKKDPNFAETRLDIMKALSDTYNDLEIELHTDVKSQAIPTFMAIRFNLVQVFQSLNEGKLAHEEIKRVYALGKERIKVKEGTDAARSNLVKIALLHAGITEKAEGIEASKRLLDEALQVARDIINDPKPSQEPGTPPIYALKYLLSSALQSNGVYHYNRGELDQAAPYFKEAGEIRSSVLQTIEENEEFKKKPESYRNAYINSLKIDFRRSTLGAATILFKTGKIEEGIEQFQAVYDLVKQEHEDDPSEKNEVELGKFSENFGFNCFKVGQLEKAGSLLNDSETIAAKYAAKNTQDLDSQYGHSVVLYRYGTLLEAQGKDEAKSRFAKCVEIRKKLSDKDPNLKNETMLMVAYARNGNPEEAIEIANRLNAKEELEGKMRIDIARAYVQSSRYVDGEEEKDLLLKKSLATIQDAIVGGYSDWFELENEPDLGPLHDLDEFKTMVAKLKQPASDPPPDNASP